MEIWGHLPRKEGALRGSPSQAQGCTPWPWYRVGPKRSVRWHYKPRSVQLATLPPLQARKLLPSVQIKSLLPGVVAGRAEGL